MNSMKKLLLLFSLLLSFNSYGEWTSIYKTDEATVYVDLKTIKKRDGYIYWWNMVDYYGSSPNAGNSSKAYLQGDCEVTRLKYLTVLGYNQPMGKGQPEKHDGSEWSYQPPDSLGGFALATSCNLVDFSYKEQLEIIEEIRFRDNRPTVIYIDKNRNYFISPMDESMPKAISFDELINIASERMMANPDMKVWMRVDNEVDYGVVLEVVAPLKKFHNPIGFLTEASEEEEYEARKLAEMNAKQEEFYRQLLENEIQKGDDNAGKPIVSSDPRNVLKNAYLYHISARIKSFWRYQGAEDDWTCEVYVVQDRDGTVVAVDVRNCNVDDSPKAKSFKDSVKRAVYKASPLPSAPDEAVFDDELVIKFSVK